MDGLMNWDCERESDLKISAKRLLSVNQNVDSVVKRRVPKVVIIDHQTLSLRARGLFILDIIFVLRFSSSSSLRINTNETTFRAVKRKRGLQTVFDLRNEAQLLV